MSSLQLLLLGHDMPKFYVKWQMNPMAIPADPEQRVKGWLSMLDAIKRDMQAGTIKDWGICCDGSSGYTIAEAASETDLYTSLLKWMPHVNFDAKPVLTIDQTIASIKKATAK
jgi:hypothetical protein